MFPKDSLKIYEGILSTVGGIQIDSFKRQEESEIERNKLLALALNRISLAAEEFNIPGKVKEITTNFLETTNQFYHSNPIAFSIATLATFVLIATFATTLISRQNGEINLNPEDLAREKLSEVYNAINNPGEGNQNLMMAFANMFTKTSGGKPYNHDVVKVDKVNFTYIDNHGKKHEILIDETGIYVDGQKLNQESKSNSGFYFFDGVRTILGFSTATESWDPITINGYTQVDGTTQGFMHDPTCQAATVMTSTAGSSFNTRASANEFSCNLTGGVNTETSYTGTNNELNSSDNFNNSNTNPDPTIGNTIPAMPDPLGNFDNVD